MTITVETQCYGPLSDDNYRSVDLYFPAQTDRNSCLLVFIHGGAWRSEDKADYKDLCTGFCELGYAVASVNYR
jgi:acetyl esterase/lipase